MEQFSAGSELATSVSGSDPSSSPQGAACEAPHPRAGRGAIESSARSSEVAKAARAARGSMRLRAVRRGGLVTDFLWEFVSASVAPLLPCDPAELLGRCMHEVDAGPLGHPALVERYRRVMADGATQSFSQVHRVGDSQAVVVHRVTGLPDGVVVTLAQKGARRRVLGRAHES